MTDIHEDKILILDFGSQYTQLIARRVREMKVYCEIHPYNISLEKIARYGPKGIILSGGPASVHEEGAPFIDVSVLEGDAPVLGICYGMQLIAQLMGGQVEAARLREYGLTRMEVLAPDPLFTGYASKDEKKTVWMSHGDSVKRMPGGFVALARSKNSPVAAFQDDSQRIFGVQFHPEVAHTPGGVKILENFAFNICGLRPLWNMRSFVESTEAEVRRTVGDSKVICALSGGVDSSVVAALIFEAIGKRLIPIFVDNGVLRKGEAEEVKKLFGEEMGMDLRFVDASEEFLKRLEGVVDPERKRMIIGNLFIEIFEKEARAIEGVKYLAQGTLYPDVIESVSFKGPSATIKTHHNVGALPEKMELKLIEPLRELFKDEVREVAREIGLPESIVGRHPFPGPGLAIRIIGEVTPERIAILQNADEIVLEEIGKAGLYHKVWQAFAVLLPVMTVGVMGDERTYENVAALRIVESVDAMTADWARVDYDVLERISSRIINEVRGINRVVYDISSKPPATIEWE